MKRCTNCHRLVLETQDRCPLDDAHLAASDELPPDGVGRVLGSYQLVALIGEGGMGNIYVGAHTRINRLVAIKVLRDELQHRPDTITRLFEEARTINRLHHPNIIESIDLVEDVVDGAYCVLELLRGEDLATRLKRGPPPIATVLHMGAQIADALAAVHALGVVHRDLKPENLISMRDDIVKLIDFGVATVSEGADTKLHGTAAYMAPEQAAGERIDGRADIYSLGVVLFEMATGRHPFPSATEAEYILAHAHDPIPRPAGVPKPLAELIVRCLAKRPEGRPASAASLASALRAIDPRVRRGTGWRVATAVLLVVGAGGTVYVATQAQTAPVHLVEQVPVHTAPKPAEPVPPPAPRATATVTFRFTSTPPGAKVTRDEETIPLGTTPFEITLPASERFRAAFELAGYEQAEVEVTGPTVTAALVPIQPAATRPPTPGHKKKSQGREGVMDPFQK